LEVVQYLIDHGADANALSAEGFTPRDLAIKSRRRTVSDFFEGKENKIKFNMW
jgi:hypothetical protein